MGALDVAVVLGTWFLLERLLDRTAFERSAWQRKAFSGLLSLTLWSLAICLSACVGFFLLSREGGIDFEARALKMLIAQGAGGAAFLGTISLLIWLWLAVEKLSPRFCCILLSALVLEVVLLLLRPSIQMSQ